MKLISELFNFDTSNFPLTGFVLSIFGLLLTIIRRLEITRRWFVQQLLALLAIYVMMIFLLSSCCFPKPACLVSGVGPSY